MLVQCVRNSARAVDGRLGERRLVEEDVHEVPEQTGGRAAVIVARVEIIRADEHIVARYEADFLVAIRIVRLNK